MFLNTRRLVLIQIDVASKQPLYRSYPFDPASSEQTTLVGDKYILRDFLFANRKPSEA